MTVLSFTARFRKHEFQIHLTTADPSLGQVASAIASATGAEEDTIKLVIPGKKGQMLRPTANPSVSATTAGVQSGMRLEVYASTVQEVQQVRNSKDLPGLASFEQELKQTMRRQRGSRNGTLTLPSGPYVFQKFEAWQRPGLFPAPNEALKLLHRLAADPGIAGIMSKHHWGVGLLSEMPPEGKVGVSPVCILGVNINSGQEISLRLRTDDLKGFRRYDRIRETLCHELAHMVWSEHDNRFKELNSQLLKECSQLDWTGHAGHVSGSASPAFENPAEPMWVDEDDVMAVTAQSSGQTLRQLAGYGPARVSPDPRRAAAMAASARVAASAANSPSSSRSASPEASRASGPLSSQEADANSMAAATAVEAQSEVAINPDADITSMGHRDPSTEQAEDAMRALGSMDFEEQAKVPQHSAGDSFTAESSVETQTLTSQTQAPTQQNDSRQMAAAISRQPYQSSDSALPHALEASGVSTSSTKHQAGSPDAKHAQRDQRDEEALMAPTGDSHMTELNVPALQQSPAAAAEQQPDESPQLRATADQEAACQQDDYTIDADPGDPDDPAVQRYRQAEAAVAQLKFEAGASGQQSALETLSKILQNIAGHPGETKFTHIRLGNAAFHSRAGQYAAARQLLKVAGFSEEEEGTADKALVWRRNDQGLIWLALSAVRNALVQPAHVH
ncbi:hypothetical protein ABBQ32_003341 [Trebouxia sp. C0010 RCD-2024]